MTRDGTTGGTNAGGRPSAAGELEACIMVVEDDEAMREMMVRALRRIGYSVQQSDDPRQVLDRLDEQAAPWKVLIADQVMPGIKGTDLVDRAKQRWPELRCILCTGCGNGASEVVDAACADAILFKPFDIRQLTALVANLADCPLAA